MSLRFGGLGLVFYGIFLALDFLRTYAPDASGAELLARLSLPGLIFPAFFWANAIIALVPEDSSAKIHMRLMGAPPLWLIIGGIYGIAAATELVFSYPEGSANSGYVIFAAAVIIPLGAALMLTRQTAVLRTSGLVLISTIFFGLGTLILLLPFGWIPRTLFLLGIGGDLVIFGYAVAVLDAFEQGETLLPDFFRSLGASFLTILLFGGQVLIVLVLSIDETFPILVACTLIMITAIIFQTFSEHIQVLVDRVAFAHLPQLRQTRAVLRATADVLSRRDDTLDVAALDDSEFARLTRRALSHLGNLPRLASSPLTRLPVVQERLDERGLANSTIERANELKAVLVESIMKLKPDEDDDFGMSDEWRYFNALYFPYVAGLKPYTRRPTLDDLDEASRKALDWFRVYVPERTLYNWQNAAATLVAKDLRETSQ